MTLSNNTRYFKRKYSEQGKIKPEFVLTRYIPYLAIMGELWSVYCDDLGENLPRYTPL